MNRFFVDPDIAIARTINKDIYMDPQIFEVSKEKIFSNSWQYIGSTDQVKTNGDVYPFTMLKDFINEPLIISRDQQGKINCMSNVCTHRGNLLINDPCKANNIRCKYHGRVFNLEGKFQAMPEFKEVKEFPSPDDDLHKLELFKWGKWMFASPGKKFSGKDFFSEMIQRMDWLPVNEFIFRPELSKEYNVDAHWALYCENYLEGFHIPFVHADLNAVIDYGNYTTELFRYSNLQIGTSRKTEDCFDLPASSPDHGKKIAAYYFWVFPNMMFNFYPWGLSVNIVNPVSINKTRVVFLSFTHGDAYPSRGAGGDLDKVEMEDEEIVQNVQKGIRSRYYNHGRYSVTREQGTHHFHRLLSEFIQ